jgi:hypothetical protein
VTEAVQYILSLITFLAYSLEYSTLNNLAHSIRGDSGLVDIAAWNYFLDLYDQKVNINMGPILNCYALWVLFNCREHPPVNGAMQVTYETVNQLEQDQSAEAATRNCCRS